MPLLIPFNPGRQAAAEDAACRLRVLYPALTICLRDGAIELGDVPPDQADDIAQSACDQLVRSRYAEDTASLRERLYARLLG